MAIETLRTSQMEAAEILGIDFAEFEEVQRPKMTHLGSIAIAGVGEFDAYRAHSGPDDLIGKGGIRLAPYDGENGLRAAEGLAREMYAKLALRGHHETFRGAKGLINAEGRLMSHDQRAEVMKQYAELMDHAGFAGYDKDVPAGDVGTNGLSDDYAEKYAELHPEDEFKQAVITGKSVEHGGLESRPGATGWGVYSSHVEMMNLNGVDRATVAVQGFGNVGAWYAYHAANDPEKRISVNAISDRYSLLYTDHEDGLPINETILREIGDNGRFAEKYPWYRGDKLSAVKAVIDVIRPDMAGQVILKPNPHEILEYEADYLVPAALGNVITEKNADKIGAKYGIIEAANGPMTLRAHQMLAHERGIDILPDIVANGGGVDCSIAEWRANVDAARFENGHPETEEVQNQLRENSKNLVIALHKELKSADVKDLRTAAALISTEAIAGQLGLLKGRFTTTS